MSGNKRFQMHVMKNPKNVATAVQSEDSSLYSPLIIGNGDIDYSCGKCGKVLCTNISTSLTGSDIHQTPFLFHIFYRKVF
jgi:hypothetical protein